MNQKKRDQLKLIAQLTAKKMNQEEVTELLRTSGRQVRLLRRYEEKGDAGLVRRLCALSVSACAFQRLLRPE